MYINNFKIFKTHNYPVEEVYNLIVELIVNFSDKFEDSLIEIIFNQFQLIIINSFKNSENKTSSKSNKIKILDKDLNKIKFQPSKTRLMFSIC